MAPVELQTLFSTQDNIISSLLGRSNIRHVTLEVFLCTNPSTQKNKKFFCLWRTNAMRICWAYNTQWLLSENATFTEMIQGWWCVAIDTDLCTNITALKASFLWDIKCQFYLIIIITVHSESVVSERQVIYYIKVRDISLAPTVKSIFNPTPFPTVNKVISLRMVTDATLKHSLLRLISYSRGLRPQMEVCSMASKMHSLIRNIAGVHFKHLVWMCLDGVGKMEWSGKTEVHSALVWEECW